MSIKELISTIKQDIKYHAVNGFTRIVMLFFFNSSFRLLLNYRVGYYLAKRRNPFINLFILMLKRKQLRRYNCDISYNAKIGKSIHFPHPTGIVIGENAIVGNNVMIWQEVTLGSHGKSGAMSDYPEIGDHVKLFSGCKIIGKVKVKSNSIVGANAVVINDVPSNHIAVGVPSKNIKKKL